MADALRHTVGRGARAVCVLNRRGRARLLACRTCGELARCEACGATVEQRDDDAGASVCGQCGTARPLGLPPLSREHVPRRAARHHPRARRPRRAAAAHRGGVGRRRHRRGPRRPACSSAPRRCCTASTGPVVGLVAYLELDQELLAPRARAAEQALWLLVRGARLLGRRRRRTAGRLLLQTRLPDHEVVQAVRHGDPMRRRRRRDPAARALGFPPFGGLAEVRGAVDAVAAACARMRWPTRGVTVLGPDAGRAPSALVRAPSVARLCDALAAPAVDAARTQGAPAHRRRPPPGLTSSVRRAPPSAEIPSG